MTDHAQRKSTVSWLLLVLLVSLLLRLGLLGLYEPVAFGDTPSYRRLAASAMNGFQRYDGTRTPGYPVFLGAVGPDERVWLFQMGLGVAITLLLFYMGWEISRQAWFAGLVALAHTLDLGQLFFEANLITETLATFWVITSLAGLFFWLRHPARRSLGLAALLGLSSALACLTRPLFLYLPFWILPFLALQFGSQEGTRQGETAAPPLRRRLPKVSVSWGQGTAFFLPVVLLLGLWANFIHQHFNMWSLTTMTGYHLIQHTGNYFEQLPEEEAALRDTYLQYREAQIAANGTQTNAIWDAIPDMQRASGLNFYSLSRKLTSLSVKLILENPGLYLENVAQGWWLFWRAPVYWSPEAFLSPELAPPAATLVLLQRLALIASNLLFVVTSILALFWLRLRARWRISPPLWSLAGTVWIASVLQALLDHGDNPRFLVPLQSLVVFWGLWVVVQTVAMRRANRKPGGETQLSP